MVEFVKYTSVLGDITIAIENDTLIGLWFDGQNMIEQMYKGNLRKLFRKLQYKRCSG